MSIYLEKVSFVAGHKPDAEPLELLPGTVTILVGPNNSGKSQTLRDIEALCLGNEKHKTKIIRSIKMDGLPKNIEDTRRLLDYSMAYPQNQKQTYFIFNDDPTDRTKHSELSFSEFDEIHTCERRIKRHIIPHYLIRLDGRTRFKLIDPEKDSESNIIGSYLRFLDGENLNTLNNITNKIFGKHIIVQRPTGANGINRDVILRVHNGSESIECNPIVNLTPFRLPKDKNEITEHIKNSFKSMKEKEYSYDKYELLTSQGDGIQAFVGIMSAVITRPKSIILIDEPEAFLADPIQKRFGSELTKISQERKGNLIVSTHSPDFVMGCIETTKNINLVRLTYEKEQATATQLDAEKIQILFKQPILRSAGVIQGLFHPATIVSEGHSDRIIYEEINRLLNEKQQGIVDALFIMSGDKNRIHKIIKPLRDIGIPAVAIVDLDFIDNDSSSGNCWSDLINACGVSGDNLAAINNMRTCVLDAFSKIKLSKPIKNQGINNLSCHDKELAKDLLKALALYGLFIVPIGEVEDWGVELDIQKPSPQNSRAKSEWPEKFLNKIEKSFDLNNEIATFLKNIANWVNDPDRKGIN